VPRAVNCTLLPAITEAEPGVTAREVSVAAVTFNVTGALVRPPVAA